MSEKPPIVSDKTEEFAPGDPREKIRRRIIKERNLEEIKEKRFLVACHTVAGRPYEFGLIQEIRKDGQVVVVMESYDPKTKVRDSGSSELLEPSNIHPLFPERTVSWVSPKPAP